VYSKKIQIALKKVKAKPGDVVGVGTKQGILMPSPDIGKPSDKIVIKLDSGYNIGISFTGKIKKISSRKTPKPKQKKLKQDKSLPSIAMLSAGGTISSRVDYTTGGVHSTLDALEILADVPVLSKIVNISEAKTLCERMSEDFDHKDWQVMASEAAKALKKTHGVIITHGTDTLHYSAAVLSFMLPNVGKPVVLTGSQRSPDRGSSDSSMNLVCSAITAKSNLAHVGTCMHASHNDDFCYFLRGTKVRKMHTSLRSAFKPINDYPLARVYPYGEVEITNENITMRSNKQCKPDTKFDPKVAIVKVYPGADPKFLDLLVKSGVRGIVVEGTGFGHVPTQSRVSWIPHIKSLVSSGITVAVAPQTIYGRLDSEVYTNLRILYSEAGALCCGDMLPETAYVKLGWVLGHTKNMKKVTEMMLTNYAGEFTERLEPDMFLFK